MDLRTAAQKTALGLSLSLLMAPVALAQYGSAQYGAAQGGGVVQAGGPAYPHGATPSSPLAGGPAAAQGGDFVDIHGRSIVMPVQYTASVPSGMGAYGDPMAIDFGGYGVDQVGPHYFDVSVESVSLVEEELFTELGGFGGLLGDASGSFLRPNSFDDDLETGFRATARVDVGPLSVVEATYLGVYDFGFDETVFSSDVAPMGAPFALFSPFNDFGTGTPLVGIDEGGSYNLSYESELQSAEISYRHYWVGDNPRVTGTILLGFRYIRLSEDFSFNTVSVVGAGTGTSTRLWDAGNDMLGVQTGGDTWIGLRQGLRLGVESKVGLYNNRFNFRHVGDFPGTLAAPLPGAPDDFDVAINGDDVAFAADAKLMMVADIWPSFSLKLGYEVLYMNSLATAANNVDFTNISATSVSTTADALFHGFNGGFEYVW